MGFLRLWLAIMVLADHSGVFRYCGMVAVECFFIISGFYMQLIILENYQHQQQWVRKFYKSRLLRIYAPYWVILLSILALSPFVPAGLQVPTVFQIGSADTLFINLFIISSDYFKLLDIINNTHPFLWDRMALPVAWSVALELMFYCIAPFLLTRFRVIVGVTLLSLGAKAGFLIMYGTEIVKLPWWDGLLDAVFPMELGLFTAGALLYRFYARCLKHQALRFESRGYYGVAVLCIVFSLAGFLAISELPPIQVIAGSYMLIALMACCVPYLFAISRNGRFDRAVGELSYPFYLIHSYLVNWGILYGFSIWKIFLTTLILTLLLSFGVVKFIETPLTRLRHRLFRA